MLGWEPVSIITQRKLGMHYRLAAKSPCYIKLEIRGANAPLILGCSMHSLQHTNIELVSEMVQMYCFWCAQTH